MRIFKCNAAIMAMILISLVSCGGGGGEIISSNNNTNDTALPPYISGSLISFQSGSNPGYTPTASITVQNSSTSADITTAIVTINNISLPYNPDSGHQAYEGDVSVAPGGNVDVSVTVGEKTYTASVAQFTSYPTISYPVAGTWYTGIPNTVKWAGGTPTANAVYNLGVLDAHNPYGDLVWPINPNNYFEVIPVFPTSSYVIPANSMTAGDRLVIAGIVTGVSISNAAYGSEFLIAGFSSIPITIVDATLTSITITPRDPSVPAGISQQFTAVGTFSNNDTADLTGQVTWSADHHRAWMYDSTPGLATTSSTLGQSQIQANLAGISDTTTLTVTPAQLVSLQISATPAAVAVNTTRQMIVQGTYTASYFQDLTSAAIWSSSDTNIATISNQAGSNGVATGVASGTTTITAQYDGQSATYDLSVPNWTLQTTMAVPSLIKAAWGNNMFFVTSGYTNMIYTSPDGVSWTPRLGPVSDSSLIDIAWSGSQFVAVGDPGQQWTKGTPVYTSPDGIAWTKQEPGIYETLLSVVWAGNFFVAVGTNGTILTSPTGTSWTSHSGASGSIRDVAWSGSSFAAVGDYYTMLYSPDALTWTSYPRASNLQRAVASSGTLFATVGFDGMILTSPDGKEWTTQVSGCPYCDLRDIIWTGSKFITVGASGRVLMSIDGITWTAEVTGITADLFSVAWSGSKIVAVGEGGTIFTSP